MLIAVLMVLFSIGGTTEGMAEETLGFYALLIPLMLALGYDRMVAAATILIGAGIGVLASTVNPFATGVASDAAGISIGDGIGFRFLMYVVLVPVGVWWVLRYARKVKADPSPVAGRRRSRATTSCARTGCARRAAADRPARRPSWPSSALTFAFMIFAIVPWAQVINGPDAASYGWQLDWYFPELAALFIVMAIVVGLIGGLGEKGLTDTIVKGAGDFIGVGLIIVLARGVTVIMNNSEITGTILHSMENVVSDTSNGVFGALMFLINIPLAFLVPSTSGHARAGDADPRAARRLRRRVAGDGRHRVPVGVRRRQPDHPDLGGGDGRPGAGQGPLRPVPAVRRAPGRDPARALHGLRGHRRGRLTRRLASTLERLPHSFGAPSTAGRRTSATADSTATRQEVNE